MIKGKELRPTNFILVNGQVEPVLEIRGGQIVYAYDPETEEPQLASFNDIEPIPLTHEWLERMGFTLDKVFAYNGVRLSAQVVWFDPEGLKVSSPFGHTIMQYVHQLQNWYFGLTNEELIIRPKPASQNNYAK